MEDAQARDDRTPRRSSLILFLLSPLFIRLPCLFKDYPIATADELDWMFRVIAKMFAGDLNPHQFEYPAGVVFSLSTLLANVTYLIGKMAGVWADRGAFINDMYAHSWQFSILFRMPIFLMGAAGVPLLYFLATKLAGHRVGWMSAAVIAVAVPFADSPAMNYTDIGAISAVVGALILAVGVVDGTTKRRELFAMGVLLGTAANLKVPYLLCWIAAPAAALAKSSLNAITNDLPLRGGRSFPALLFVLGIVVTWASWPWTLSPELLRDFPQSAASFLFLKRNVGLLGLALAGAGMGGILFPAPRACLNFAIRNRAVSTPILVAVVTFLCWSPFYLANIGETIGSLMIVSRNIDPESVGVKAVTWHARILERSATELVGPVLGLIGIAGIIVLLWRRDSRDLVVLSPALAWFAYTGFASYSKLNLMYLFIPFIAIDAARLLAPLTTKVGVPLLVIGLAFPVRSDVELALRVLKAPGADTRQQVKAWYHAECPQGEPLAQDPNVLIVDHANPSVYQVPLPRRDFDKIRASGVRFVIVNSRTQSYFQLTDEQMHKFSMNLEERARRVAELKAGPDIGGPDLTVWELRR